MYPGNQGFRNKAQSLRLSESLIRMYSSLDSGYRSDNFRINFFCRQKNLRNFCPQGFDVTKAKVFLEATFFIIIFTYSEVPNRRADRNKRAGLEKSATLLAYLLSKLINEQGGIFRLLN